MILPHEVWVGNALYMNGRLDPTLPFQQLQQIVSLDEIAGSAAENGFGDHTRR